MKIAIDLNDVVRDFTYNFLMYYVKGYNHQYDPDDFNESTNDMELALPFKTTRAYEKFVYEDYPFELFGKCPTCTKKLTEQLNEWTEQTLKDIDTDEPIDIMFVSTMEYGASIGNTYFFLSKLGTKIRETYFPTDSSTIWDRCDVLITANPSLLNEVITDRISNVLPAINCSRNLWYKSHISPPSIVLILKQSGEL